jgi:ribosomal protein S14
VTTDRFPDFARGQCYWALAGRYLSSAAHLLQIPSGQVYVPTLFLLGHALELYFKAFLASQGMTDKDLKNRVIGHDLIACLRECRDRGLHQYVSLSRTQVRQIARVNFYYKEKHLEYFTGRSKYFGSIEMFKLIVEQISKAVFIPITDPLFRAPSDRSPCGLG